MQLNRITLIYPVISFLIFWIRLYYSTFFTWQDFKTLIPNLYCFYCHAPSDSPYGILWWVVSVPLRYNYALSITFVDFFIMIIIRRQSILFPVYAFMSWWLWLQAPFDVPILWYCLLGLIDTPLVIFGALAKLPFGAPWPAQQYILTKQYNPNDIQYYSYMGIVFMWVIIQSMWNKRNDTKK